MTWPVHRSSSLPMRFCASCVCAKVLPNTVAHAAAGGIDVALHALQAHLRGEIRLGLRRAGQRQQRTAPRSTRSRFFMRGSSARSCADVEGNEEVAAGSPSASPSSTWPALSASATGPRRALRAGSCRPAAVARGVSSTTFGRPCGTCAAQAARAHRSRRATSKVPLDAAKRRRRALKITVSFARPGRRVFARRRDHAGHVRLLGAPTRGGAPAAIQRAHQVDASCGRYGGR